MRIKKCLDPVFDKLFLCEGCETSPFGIAARAFNAIFLRLFDLFLREQVYLTARGGMFVVKRLVLFGYSIQVKKGNIDIYLSICLNNMS